MIVKLVGRPLHMSNHDNLPHETTQPLKPLVLGRLTGLNMRYLPMRHATRSFARSSE